MAGLNGYSAAVQETKALQKKAIAAFSRAAKTVADRIATDAKANAKGSLPNGISAIQTENGATLIGGTEIAAYNEFGTGRYAELYLAALPDEVKDEARKFYIDGSGQIPAAPFFFPAIFKHQGDIPKEFDKEIKKK